MTNWKIENTWRGRLYSMYDGHTTWMVTKKGDKFVLSIFGYPCYEQKFKTLKEAKKYAHEHYSAYLNIGH